MIDYTNEEEVKTIDTERVIIDFCLQAIEINDFISDYHTEFPKPTDDQEKQFLEELSIKTEILRDIKNVLRYVYMRTHGYQTDGTKKFVNMLIDSDQKLGFQLSECGEGQEVLFDLQRTKAMFMNQLYNRQLIEWELVHKFNY